MNAIIVILVQDILEQCWWKTQFVQKVGGETSTLRNNDNGKIDTRKMSINSFPKNNS